MILAFKLSMPSNSAWNGKWSGISKFYVKTHNFGTSKKGVIRAKTLLNVKTPQWESQPESGYYSYNFGDGWRAGIAVYIIDSKIATRLQRQSDGFCGYDWMVDNLITYGEILTSEQCK